MRRFIKTFTVRRHVQYVVVQDGDRQEFAVQRWAAEDQGPELVTQYLYRPDDSDSRDRARRAAVQEAWRLCEAERLGLQATGATEARLD